MHIVFFGSAFKFCAPLCFQQRVASLGAMQPCAQLFYGQCSHGPNKSKSFVRASFILIVIKNTKNNNKCIECKHNVQNGA